MRGLLLDRGLFEFQNANDTILGSNSPVEPSLQIIKIENIEMHVSHLTVRIQYNMQDSEEVHANSGVSLDGPPTKRRRLSNDSETTTDVKNENTKTQPTIETPTTTLSVDEDQLSKEVKSGITEYVHPDTSGFTGVLKQRYTDFIVNEILPDGRVLHLQNLAAPKQKRKQEDPAAQSESEPVKIEEPSTSPGDGVAEDKTGPVKDESSNGEQSSPTQTEPTVRAKAKQNSKHTAHLTHPRSQPSTNPL